MSEWNEMSEILGKDGGLRVSMPLCERTVSHEISEEVILPEERPEIRRILSVVGRILPPSKYVGSGNAEWNGSVEYTLLYLTGSGALCAATARADYGFGVPLESGGADFDMGEGVRCFVSTVTDQLSARALGGRRVGLRHRMRSRIRVFGQMTLGEVIRGEGEHRLERKTREGRCMRALSVTSDPLPFREELSLPSENTRVAGLLGDLFLSSANASQGVATVTGEIHLRMLTDSEVIVRKLPFEGTVSSEELEAGMQISAEGILCGLTVEVEGCRALCSGEVIFSARAMAEEPLLYTEDLYSTERESVCEYGEYDLPTSLKTENRNLSVSERIPLGDLRIPAEARVAAVWGEPRIESCEQTGGKALLSGVCRYTVLAETNGEYGVYEITRPWRLESEIGKETVKAWDGSVEAVGCRGRVEGDLFCLDGELSLRMDYFGTYPIRTVTEVSLGEPCQNNGAHITVYYPNPEESPWDVAKKYKVPAASLKGTPESYFIL